MKKYLKYYAVACLIQLIASMLYYGRGLCHTDSECFAIQTPLLSDLIAIGLLPAMACVLMLTFISLIKQK